MKILRRSVITYYSINFSQHKNYNFNDAKKALDDFALAFERVFSPGKKVKIQVSMELINYQPTEIIELESKRVWMTDAYVYVNFLRLKYKFVKAGIKNDLMKRVIINRMAGSSWRFKRFARISMIDTAVNKTSIVSS